MVAAFVDSIELPRNDAVQVAARQLLEKMAKSPGESCVWSLRDLVWPGLDTTIITEQWIEGVRLRLLPLSRLGQTEGKSGSLVLVGRFEATGMRRSCHLVVKTRAKEDGELAREWDRAQIAKPYTYERKDSFAIPIDFCEAHSEFSVLWSLCFPANRESEDGASALEVDPVLSKDLRSLLGGSEDNLQAAATLRKTYALLRSLHHGHAAPQAPREKRGTRTWGVEYREYLRKYGTKWGSDWASVWASPSVQTVRGKANPIWVVERLMSRADLIQLGLVHGDLHPGNVMLRDGEFPAIIDFGWSAADAHIAKDFALMECNLRFLSLKTAISDEELAPFVSCIDWTHDTTFESPYLTDRAELIRVVREAAGQVFDSGSEWRREYTVALFIVAFGLLRYAPFLGNERAALRFIEELADQVATSLALS